MAEAAAFGLLAPAPPGASRRRAAPSAWPGPGAGAAPRAPLLKGPEGFDPPAWRSEAARTVQTVLRARPVRI